MKAKEFITENYGVPKDDMEAEQLKEFAEMMEGYAKMKISRAEIESRQKVLCKVEEEIESMTADYQMEGDLSAVCACEAIVKMIYNKFKVKQIVLK